MADGFAARVQRVIAEHGRLCVGIDPHERLLHDWGLPASAAGARDFGLRVVDAAAGRVGVVKPQVAFFERYGATGYGALESVLAAARSAGLLVIADAKRGDIDTSVESYGDAWLTPGSPLESDALTVVAYQGLGSLDRVIARAESTGKGLFVLAATSNPEAVITQTAVRSDGRTVASGLVADIRARTSPSLGVVVGATIDVADYGIALSDLAGIPVLAPGFGAQGAVLGDLARLFGPAAGNTLASVSRSVLGGGPGELIEALNRATTEVAA
ncbi:MAG: pyrF [Schumannella sp.]|nr:pyrF [Schumannella sp.]